MDVVLDIAALALFKEHSLYYSLLIIVSGLVLRTFYRLYFGPLHHIPGPKLAAATHLYEFYHDAIRSGLYIWEIEKMHEEYGPIVRINPREIHIKDPYFYDEIYAPSNGAIREKDVQGVKIFPFPVAMVATVGHEQHRMRRKLLSNFFSRRSIERIEPVAHEALSKFLEGLTKAHEENRVINLIDHLQSLAGEVVTQYAFGRSYNLQEPQNIGRGITKVAQESTSHIHLQRFAPYGNYLMRVIPRWALAWFLPARLAVYELLDGLREQSLKALRAKESHVDPINTDKSFRLTMFDALTAPDVPPSERTLPRLQDEGFAVFGAGTETTASTITVGLFHILSDRMIYTRLRQELDEALPSAQSLGTWRQLEKLPHLNGVVQEALRHSGFTMRLQRVSPTDVIKYKNIVIPPRTPVSMIGYFVHMDPNIFPDPKRFNPERWIRGSDNKETLSRFLVTFGKGSRSCIALNLAYAEIYNTIAAVIRRFELELYETTAEDISWERDLLMPRSKNGPWRVRVKVVGIRED